MCGNNFEIIASIYMFSGGACGAQFLFNSNHNRQLKTQDNTPLNLETLNRWFPFQFLTFQIKRTDTHIHTIYNCFKLNQRAFSTFVAVPNLGSVFDKTYLSLIQSRETCKSMRNNHSETVVFAPLGADFFGGVFHQKCGVSPFYPGHPCF